MEKNSDPDSGIEISLIWDQEFGGGGGGGGGGTGKSKFFLFRITYLRIQKPKKYLRIPNTVVV